MSYFFENDATFRKDIGCTQQQFEELYSLTKPHFDVITQKGMLRKRSSRSKSSHSDKFQLLVTLFWLRRYLEEEFIGRIFGISQQ